MRSKIKKPELRTVGLVSLVLGLLLESVLHPATKAGHFAGGLLLGCAIVFLIASTGWLHGTRTHHS